MNFVYRLQNGMFTYRPESVTNADCFEVLILTSLSIQSMEVFRVVQPRERHGKPVRGPAGGLWIGNVFQ